MVLVSLTGAPRDKVFLLHSKRGIVKGLGLGVGDQGIDTDTWSADYSSYRDQGMVRD